ncbi:PKD domain-containing protein [Hyphomonas sp. NPDC076900]|uniref:PKD domain-containing protein n=1 Tax=unclassified Hyphomonas TaxID=2630699 RepID=UPI003CFF7C67
MKTRSTQRLKGAAAAVFAGLTLAACGGGGGSSSGGAAPPVSPSPPPPPPPPPVNAAPTAQATATPAAPQEGQPFVLDASASTDPEGAALTYTWSQLSGPPVTLAAPNQARLELATAEVTEDTEAVFRVAVSDGTNTSTEDVSVTFSNIAQTPLLESPFTFAGEVTLPYRPIIWATLGLYAPILGTEETPGGEVTFHKVEADFSQSIATLNIIQALSRTFAQPLVVEDKFGFLFANRTSQIAIADSESFRLYGTPEPNEAELSLLTELPIQNICSMVSKSFPQEFIAGLRNGGFEIHANSPINSNIGPSLRQKYASNQSVCALFSPTSSVNGESLPPVSAPNGRPDVLGYNLDTRSIERYAQPPTGSTPHLNDFVLVESSSVPLGSGDMQFVAAKRIENILALVFSDGEHAGEHRLVIAGLNADRNIVQSVFSWPIGAPDSFLDIWQVSNDTQGYELIILSQSSPQAIVFSVMDSQNPFNSIEGPRFMEVGLGAAAGGMIPYILYDPGGFVTLHPDSRKVRVFLPAAAPAP